MRTFALAMAMAGLLMLLSVRGVLADAMLLEVSRNGRDSDIVLPVTREGAHLFVMAQDFATLGILLPVPAKKEGRIDLAAVTGLTAELDETGQRLLLTAPAAALPHQLYDLRADTGPMPAPQSGSGAILRYDLSVTADDARAMTGGASFGLDIFTPQLRFANSAFAVGGAHGWNMVRLDSAAIIERPETLSHLVLGDAISVTPAFGRAVRFGGVQWASDFALRPGLVIQPLPAFFGQSEVPATVDVFSGAARVFQQVVEPGPFELRNLPVLTGGGNATIVTRDVLGRENTQSISLYTDAGLLAPGLESFALDAGFIRTGYGHASFGYDAPMLSGDWRRGLSDRLTIQAHGESAPGLVAASGGAEWGLGFGSIAADAAFNNGDHAGHLLSLSAQARSGAISFYGQALSASRGWRDLASLLPGDGGVLPPRLRYQLGATTDLDWGGTLGMSWIGAKYSSQSARQLLSASWSVQLPDGAFAALGALKDLQGGAVSVQLSLNMSLGGNGLAGITAASDNGRLSGQALIDSPANPDGGFGYRMAGGWRDGGRFQGEADWIGPRIALDGGISLDHGRAALRADASGALVFLRGSLFASRNPGDAVALVQTGDPGIRIYRENRPVAVSDGDGEALLTGLDAWAPNRIAVEARDYDFNALVEKTEALVVPRRAGGVVVDFTPRSRHPVLATVTRGIPMATPMGARVLLDGDDSPLTLGRDGQLFIAALEKPRGAVVEIGSGRCRLYIEPEKRAGTMTRTKPLLCLREASGAY